jgi:hypothetical protein
VGDDRQATVVGEDAAIALELGQEDAKADRARLLQRVHDPPEERTPFAGDLDVIGERGEPPLCK